MELHACIPSPPSLKRYTQYDWKRFVCWWCFHLLQTVNSGRFEPEQHTVMQAEKTSQPPLKTPFYCVRCLCDKDHPRSPEHAVIQKDGTIVVRKKVNQRTRHQNNNNTRICTYCINCNAPLHPQDICFGRSTSTTVWCFKCNQQPCGFAF